MNSDIIVRRAGALFIVAFIVLLAWFTRGWFAENFVRELAFDDRNISVNQTLPQREGAALWHFRINLSPPAGAGTAAFATAEFVRTDRTGAHDEWQTYSADELLLNEDGSQLIIAPLGANQPAVTGVNIQTPQRYDLRINYLIHSDGAVANMFGPGASLWLTLILIAFWFLICALTYFGVMVSTDRRRRKADGL